MTLKRLMRIWVVTILLVATTYGHPNPETTDAKGSDDTPPGSAGHHGSVQSGQFLLTNNENYGLQISHKPYSSSNDDDEELPSAQQLTAEHRSADPATPTTDINNEGIYCAGCTPLNSIDKQAQLNGNRPPTAYTAPGQKKRYRSRNRPQQVPFTTGHNSNMQQQPQPLQQGYSYSVDLQEHPGQGTQRGVPNSPSWDGMGGWNSWTQQPQSQQSPRSPQQYQWGQKIQQVPQSRQQNFNRMDPATVQHLQIKNDGQYSFGYNAADSSRQEQRNLDGSVSGSYAYTDPTGQQVQVDYRASPNEGYHAFGPSIPLQNPNPLPVSQFQLPVPVQDTPEVQAARAQFFETYNQQLKFIEQAHAQAKARTIAYKAEQAKLENEQQTEPTNMNGKIVSVDSENKKEASDEDVTTTQQPTEINKEKELSSTDRKNDPENHDVAEDDELDNDAVVISRDDDEPSSVPAAVKLPPKPKLTALKPSQTQGVNLMQPNQDGPQAGYSLHVVVGAGGDQGNGARGVENQQQWPYWGTQNQNQYQNQYQSQYQNQYQSQYQNQPFTVGYQYPMEQSQSEYGSSSFNNAVAMPVPSYKLSHMVGMGVPPQPQGMSLGYYPQQQQVSVPVNNQASPIPMNGNVQQNADQQVNRVDADKTGSPSPAYFYYVSVGGSPHYVSSSNLFNTEFPTSLKAQLVGAVPLDARHDPQVPHQNMDVVQNEMGTKDNRPVYLDMDTSKMSQGSGMQSSTSKNQAGQPLTIVGFIPGALVSLRNGGYVNVNSAAVAHSGNGGGTSVKIQTNSSPGQGGNTHQFPLLIFNQK